MGCSALLCGRFPDSQESRFRASKPSNRGSAVLESARSADTREFCFQAAKVQIWTLSNCKFSICDSQEWDLRLRKFQIRAVPSCKRVDLLMNRNNVFTVRNVLCSNEVDLLMHRNRVFSVEFSDIVKAVLKVLRFADTQKS